MGCNDMIIKNGFPQFDETNPHDYEKMEPAFNQILGFIRQNGLTYNETDALFEAVKKVLPELMIIPKDS